MIGTATLYSAGEASFSPWAKKHLIRFFVFLFIMITIAMINLKLIYKYAYFLFFLSIILLLYLEIIGSFGNEAERWIKEQGPGGHK